MFKNKGLLGIFLAVALVAAQVIAAQAASSGQTVTSTDTPTGTAVASVTPSPTLTAADCLGSGGTASGGTPTAGGTPVAGSTSTNPVAEALCNAFPDILNLSELTDVGYGEIAQACFIAQELNSLKTGQTYTCNDILNAKQSGDWGSLNLQGVNNWGQLKKVVFMTMGGLGNEGHKSLGQVMGHAYGRNGTHGKPSNPGGGGD